MLCYPLYPRRFFFFFFNDTATTEIYTLSLHDALPIYQRRRLAPVDREGRHVVLEEPLVLVVADDHGDVRVHGAQGTRQLVEGALAGLRLRAIRLGPAKLGA